ncbi:Uncharacterized protein dnm_085780 [Desulfonema magnum]|uniref:Uncharacterized protein n=1 Tax=Desulfonema magnum TaxID=45655 RepID=A0A975BVQ1_9BACT|nr:Uncharacterized protein dnm_085780 [Desulfonema magnum]
MSFFKHALREGSVHSEKPGFLAEVGHRPLKIPFPISNSVISYLKIRNFLIEFLFVV